MIICERGFGAALYPCVLTDWPLIRGYGERYIKGSCEVTTESGQRKVRQRRERAHVVALTEKLGRPLLPGMQANHHCDDRACIEHRHLYEGTQQQNVQDMWDRKRVSTPVSRGLISNPPKLTPKQCDLLRQRYAEGEKTMLELAQEFGVCKATVSKIWRENPLPLTWRRGRYGKRTIQGDG